MRAPEWEPRWTAQDVYTLYGDGGGRLETGALVARVGLGILVQAVGEVYEPAGS